MSHTCIAEVIFSILPEVVNLVFDITSHALMKERKECQPKLPCPTHPIAPTYLDKSPTVIFYFSHASGHC